jgi:hypothetical protein
MGQYKRYEKKQSWFQLILCFLAGSLLMAVFVYGLTYYSPGLIPAWGFGKVLGLGLVFLVAPIWAYFRKRKCRPRDSAI